MQSGSDRTIAVLLKALSVARGVLYSARSGDASAGEIERILDSTSAPTLIYLIGEEAYVRAVALAEALPHEDRDTLLSIRDDPY